MKKLFFFFALLMFSSIAFASANEQGCNSSAGQANGCGTVINPTVSPTISVNPSLYNGNVNVNNLSAQGGAGGSASSGSSASSAASSSSESSANNTGNNQSVTFSSPEKVTVKSTGEAPSVIGSATAPCRVAVGASAGWLGGAFGIGTSVMDESCNVREISRHLYNLGLKAEAIKVMCTDEVAKAAMGTYCKE